MLDGLIHWSLGNRVLVLGVSALLLAGGTYTATTMPVDVLPDLTAPTVTILVEGGGMAPTDMEALVTFPIEAALNGAPGVRRVRSATAVGVAVIWVEFDWGQDIYRARQAVSERLVIVSRELPPDVAQPVMTPVSSIMGEVLFSALESDRHSPRELRTMADAVIRRRLLAVPGVAQVTVTGGDRRQYEVVVTPEQLAEYTLTLGDVETALASNRNASAGFRISGGQEYLVRGIGRLNGLDDIAETVVATRGTSPILIGDLGVVRIGEAPKRGDGSHNAAPAVILGIQKQPDVNTLELTAALDAVFADLQSSLPEGMTIATDIFRQADFIDAAIANLTNAVRDGTILVVLVVLLFLGNLRAGGIALVAIPLSLVGAMATIKLLGGTINSMTLGGMAIAIGALVDDAIIDVENVVRRLRENGQRPEGDRRPTLEVVYRASREIRGSIVFATLVIMLVFLPLFFLAGVEGRLLQPLGLAYLVALFTSLVVALTVTPVLCSYLLPHSRAVARAEDVWIVSWLKQMYRQVLPVALDHAVPDAGHRWPGPGDCAGGRGPSRPVVSAGVQRRRADDQRRDRARCQSRGIQSARRQRGAAVARDTGGDQHRPTGPGGPSSTSTCRASSRRRSMSSFGWGSGRRTRCFRRFVNGFPWFPARTSRWDNRSPTGSTTCSRAPAPTSR